MSQLVLSERWRVDLERALGEGGFGAVYGATELETSEKVAAKRVRLSSAAEREAYADEVAVLRAVAGHASVVGLRDAVELAGDGWLVMELCSGGELFDRLIDSGVLTERAARPYFAALVSALAHCHARGVVHRDVKLENVMLCADDPHAIRLIDFGLAVQLPLNKDGSIEEVWLHEPAGTLSYRAPELTRAGYLAPPVDVWSLGIVLFALCSGFFPLSEARPQGRAGTGDWRFTKLAQAQLSGVGACDAVFAMYKRSCPFSRPLRALLDAMLAIDVGKRATLKQVAEAEWLGPAPAEAGAEAYHAAEPFLVDEAWDADEADASPRYRCTPPLADGLDDAAPPPEGAVALCRQRARRDWED